MRNFNKITFHRYKHLMDAVLIIIRWKMIRFEIRAHEQRIEMILSFERFRNL